MSRSRRFPGRTLLIRVIRCIQEMETDYLKIIARIEERRKDIEGKRCGYCIVERSGQCPLHRDERECRTQAPERDLNSFTLKRFR